MNLMPLIKNRRMGAVIASASLAALATGCVERRVAYVPVYQPQPVYAVQPGAAAPVAPVVVQSAPPAPIVEVVPVAPGPAYAWVPGYWSWNGRWVWVRGNWGFRPRPHAVWVSGRWVPHGHGYVWVGGRWR